MGEAKSKDEVLSRILGRRAIAIVRLDDGSHLVDVAEAIKAGSLDIIEFTMNTPGALDAISDATRVFGDEVLMGAGTVLDPDTARAAISAGATFVVSPTLNKATIETCHRYGVVAIPGTFTPTEILAAWECGADLVKVFPASVGGPAYIRDLLGPLPQVRLVPTGRVTPTNAADFINAGAVAVGAGIGRTLVTAEAMKDASFTAVTQYARELMAAVRSGGQ
jgi:2-dehydro-3-deoxyphosphogluconate aldolase/(4S)-4-hydroxy-2-oxoglutarate aldolase